MNDSTMTDEKYITIKELAELKGVSARAIRLSRGKYITQDIIVKGGKVLRFFYQALNRNFRINIIQKLFRLMRLKNFRHQQIFINLIKQKLLH